MLVCKLKSCIGVVVLSFSTCFLTMVVFYNNFQFQQMVTLWPGNGTLAKPSTILTQSIQTFNVCWYNPPNYLQKRPAAYKRTFDKCQYSNCRLLTGRSHVQNSDAVLFYPIGAPKTLHRAPGQIWIFVEHESPYLYSRLSHTLTLPFWSKAYNWSMTYNVDNTDIPLPYGKIRKRAIPVRKNYTRIWEQKTGGALIITSHCKTHSNRLEYIKELNKYYPVEILGSCGKKWSCGKRTLHNDCFEILNKYKFYLAFENAFCKNYFTEKIFENFAYDTMCVVRGGLKGDIGHHFPNGTVISVDDFDSPKSLGAYLKRLASSRDEYIEFLKRKDQYESVTYEELYQDGLCEICKRLNYQDKYQKVLTLNTSQEEKQWCSSK